MPTAITRCLPDETINFSDMFAYGYSWSGMLPVNRRKAMELYQHGCPILLLFPDNTEHYVDKLSEIKNFDGIFGIEKEVWEELA